MAPAKGIYVVLSLLTCEGYFIRGETYDLAIFFVELTFAFDEPASQEAVDEWKSGRSPKFGAAPAGEF